MASRGRPRQLCLAQVEYGVSLRRAGMEWREIGRLMGTTHTTAHKWVLHRLSHPQEEWPEPKGVQWKPPTEGPEVADPLLIPSSPRTTQNIMRPHDVSPKSIYALHAYEGTKPQRWRPSPSVCPPALRGSKRLSAATASEIRDAYASREKSIGYLAAEYACEPSKIKRVLSRELYGDVR